MIGSVKKMQRGSRAQAIAYRAKKIDFSELVAAALQEKQRHVHAFEVLAPFRAWTIRRMERKAEKHQPSHTLQRMLGSGQRSHPAAHRFAAREQIQCPGSFRSGSCRGTHRGR